MKTITLKRAKSILAIFLALLMLVPMVYWYSSSKEANAETIRLTGKRALSVYFEDVSDSVYFIDSMINVEVGEFKDTLYYATAQAFDKEIYGNIDNVPIFNEQTLFVTISAPGVSVKDVVENTSVAVTSYLTSKTGELYQGTESFDVDDYITHRNGNIQLNFKIRTRGTSISFKVYDKTGNGIKNAKSLSVCKATSYSNESDEYGYVSAKMYGGESIYARVRLRDDVTESELKTWGKNLCLVANSLSVMTGVENDTVFLYFDAPNSNYGCCSHGVYVKSSSWTFDKFAYTSFNSDAMNDEYKIMNNSSKSTLKYSTIHEIAHSYASPCCNDEFRNNYAFSTKTYPSSGEEFFVNVRALTALEYCNNLKNYRVLETVNGKDIYSRYDEIYYSRNPGVKSNDLMFYFARGLTNCGSWNALEEFYRGTNVTPYDAQINRQAALEFYNALGIDKRQLGKVMNPDGFKLVNALRELYELSSGKEYELDDFIDFIDKTFVLKATDDNGYKKDLSGMEFMKKYVDYFFINV